jgi:hypothetical protein
MIIEEVLRRMNGEGMKVTKGEGDWGIQIPRDTPGQV